MRILAIDPGSAQSALLVFDHGTPRRWSIWPNLLLLMALRGDGPAEATALLDCEVVVIEAMQSYGMPVGREVFDAVLWSGRFEEAAHPIPVAYLSRPTVKAHICGTVKAKDPNVRQALLDRWGGTAAGRKGGVLYGISKDVWSALAIAVTYAETHP